MEERWIPSADAPKVGGSSPSPASINFRVMAKGSGGTKSASTSKGAKDFARLQNSKDWFISTGMGKYAAQKDDKDYDFSDLSGLNEQEKTYVVAYLNNAYRTVNNSLRGTEPNADGDLLATKISSAIKKLKTYEGETYRRMSVSNKEAQKLLSYYKDNKGKEVTFKEFLSTGKNQAKIKSKFSPYTNETSLDFVIQSKRGRDLRRYNSEEKEILFDKGSRFKVVSVSGKTIRLAEV